jgi:hypothetical protein
MATTPAGLPLHRAISGSYRLARQQQPKPNMDVYFSVGFFGTQLQLNQVCAEWLETS